MAHSRVGALFAVLILAGYGARLDAASAVGTAFTYQGQLQSTGAPQNGPCDFQFDLFDGSSGEASVAPTQSINNVVLTNGLFTVQLDFGAAFTGEERWLQTAVRCPAGSGGFVALTPRQRMTAVPYALFANAAATAAGPPAVTTIALSLPSTPYTLVSNAALSFGSGVETRNCRSIEAFLTVSSGDPDQLDVGLVLSLGTGPGVRVSGTKLGLKLGVQAWAFLVPGTGTPAVAPNATLQLQNPPGNAEVIITAATLVCLQ